VAGAGDDHGLRFNYYWVELVPGLTLAGNQHRWLDQIPERIMEHQARS